MLFLGCLVLILILTILFFSSQEHDNQNNHTDIEKIEYGKVYTFSMDGDTPAYIKFLDEKKYVAVPNEKTPENSFGDGEEYNLSFIQGEYKVEDEQFILGIKIERAVLFFNNDDELKKHEYDEKYVSVKPGTKTFEKGKIVKKGKFWIYERKVNENSVSSKLKGTQKRIPDSIDEFLSGYKQVEREE